MSLRWQKGDYIRLGKAVAQFNRQVTQNETQINKQYLPKLVDYSELRDRIQTRQGLNAYIQGLKRANIEGAFDLEKLENGEYVTKYQKGELERGRAQAMKSLQKEINQQERQTKVNLGIDADIKLPNAFKSQKQKELEAKIRDYKNLYTLKGEVFRRRALELGINQTELKYRRAYVFRQNYMKVMKEKYSNFKNYRKFIAWANRHKNPIMFYEALPDNEYYPDDLYYQSDNTFSEENFDSFLESLGIELEEEQAKSKRS